MVGEERPDAGDEKQVKKNKKKKQSMRDKQLTELRDILDSVKAREFIWRILSECGMTTQAPFGDALQMARFEGRRDIGLWLAIEIAQAPGDAYSRMQAEALARDNRGN